MQPNINKMLDIMKIMSQVEFASELLSFESRSVVLISKMLVSFEQKLITLFSASNGHEDF